MLKKYRQVSAIFTDTDTTSQYHKNSLIPLIPILKYRYMTTKKQVEEMEVAEMKMLRFAMAVTRKDKIKNEYIRGIVKVERLGKKMRESGLRWYGHVMRRDLEYVRRKMMEMKLTGKRKRGRPKRRFLDVLKEDMGSWCKGDGHPD